MRRVSRLNNADRGGRMLVVLVVAGLGGADREAHLSRGGGNERGD